MTNEQIIFNERLDLMEKGTIGTTGKMIVVEDAEGNRHQLREPEQIHTFMEWKRRGYQVKHGEHAVTKLNIWKHTVKKAEKEEDADKEKMFMKLAFFFTASQVEPIEQTD